MRIIGSPGTGKTTYLANKIEQLARYYKTSEMCLTSFTKASARVLAERIDDAGRIATLHSLCYENIGRPELFESNLKEWNTKYPAYALQEEKVTDLDEPYCDESSANEIWSEIQVYRARMVDKEFWSKKAVTFYDRLCKFKEERELWDFTDLIEFNLQFISKPPGNPKCLVVDEAQDLTKLEMALIKKWSMTCDQFFIAGDSDQCLYSFKGSDPTDFASLPNFVEILQQSHRVPMNVWAFAKRIIKRIKDREESGYLPKDEEGSVHTLNMNYKSPHLLKSILKHVEEGKTVMLLATCSYMIDPIKNLLKHNGTPFHNPYRLRRGDWNPIRQGRTGHVTACEALTAWKQGEKGFMKWQKPLKKSIFARGFTEEVKRVEKTGKGLDFLWAHYVPQVVKARMGDIKWYIENCLKSKQKGFEFPQRVLNAGNKIDEAPKICIGTIHSVKGGEADVVYLFPDLSASAYRNMDDSTHRTFYVGATRAKQELYLCKPANRGYYQW